MYERALAIYEKAYGPDHPDVAHTLTDLAVLHLEQVCVGGRGVKQFTFQPIPWAVLHLEQVDGAAGGTIIAEREHDMFSHFENVFVVLSTSFAPHLDHRHAPLPQDNESMGRPLLLERALVIQETRSTL